MISYEPLWKLLKERRISTYVLRNKEGFGGGTVQRLKKNLSVSTNTLNDLCKLLKCELSDIAVYIED